MRYRAESAAVLGLLIGVTYALGAMPGVAAAAPPSSPPVVQDPSLAVTGLVERGSARLAADGTIDQTSVVGATPEVSARVALEFRSSTKGLKVGDIIPSRYVATAVSDSKGAYELRFTPDSEIVAAAKSNDGWVNFQLVTTTNDGTMNWHALSRHWNGRSWDGLGRPGFAPTEVQRTLIGTDSATGKSLPGTTFHAVKTSNAVTPDVPTCFWHIDSYSYDNTTIMEFHNQQDADGRWSYGSTADSDIDVGLKSPGNDYFQIEGSAHVGTSTGASIGGTTPYNYDRSPLTGFRYAHASMPCYVGTYYQVYADLWTGGAGDTARNTGVGCLTAPQVDWRVTNPKNTNFSRTSSRATKIQGAVSVGGSISLGATSGYSGNVAMSWTWTRNFGWTCGKDNWPTVSGVVYLS